MAWLVCLTSAGCYASHERPADGPRECVGHRATCPVTSPATPRGACMLEEGFFVFGDTRTDLVCSLQVGDATDFARVESDTCTVLPLARVLTCCGEPSNPRVVVDVPWPAQLTLGLATPVCAAVSEREPSGPYEPMAPRAVCDDPLAWSGVPIVVSVVDRIPDACAGAVSTERCAARIEAGRIVVSPEVAPVSVSECDHVEVDRVAACVVPPLAPGAYDVVDESGHLLGTVSVPAAPPADADRAPTCVDVPR
jgi:hypothetical protein